MTKPSPAAIAAPRSLFPHPSRNSSQKKAFPMSLPAALPAVLPAVTVTRATAADQIAAAVRITAAVRNATRIAPCMMPFAIAAVPPQKFLSNHAATSPSIAAIALIGSIPANLSSKTSLLAKRQELFLRYEHDSASNRLIFSQSTPKLLSVCCRQCNLSLIPCGAYSISQGLPGFTEMFSAAFPTLI